MNNITMPLIHTSGQVTIHATKDFLSSGTHGQGEITATFEKLVMTFGSPERGDMEKTQGEWTIMTPAGIATLYDWKQGDCYHGLNAGTPLSEVTEWSIGGHNKEVVEWIKKALRDDAYEAPAPISPQDI